MAVAYEASSQSSAAANPGASVASFNWSHGGTAPKAVVVFVFEDSATDYISGVTYGGVAMTDLGSSYRATDTAVEPGSVKTYFLNGDSIPTGSQSVVVSCTNNATEKYAVAVSFTGASGKILQPTGVVTQNNDGALAVVAVTDGSPGSNSVRIAAAYYGGAAVAPAGTGSTARQSNDSGNYGYAVVTETTPGQGSRNVGFNNATSDDRATVHFAVAELGTINAVTASDTGATITESLADLKTPGITSYSYSLSDKGITPGGTSLRSINFDVGGIAGSNITTNDLGSPDAFNAQSAILPVRSTAQIYRGAFSMLYSAITASQTSVFTGLGTLTGNSYARIYLYLPSLPSDNNYYPINFRSAADGSSAILRILSSGVIQMRDASNSQIGSDGSVAVATGQWVRIEVRVLPGTGGTGQMEYRLYNTADSLTVTDTGSASGTLAANTDRIAFGSAISSVSPNITFYMDEIEVSTAGWIGPVGTGFDSLVAVKSKGRSAADQGVVQELHFFSNLGTSGSGDDNLNGPYGMCTDGTHLYIMDSLNHRLMKRLLNGLTYVAQIGSNGTGNDQFTNPTDMCTDGTHLYISDFSNDRIKKHLASTLAYVSKLGSTGTGDSNFDAPRGMATDGTHLYIADSVNNRIKKHLCSDLSYVTSIGTAGSGNDQFNNPCAIAYDSGYIYIADGQNNRIHKRLASDLSFVAMYGSTGTGNDQYIRPQGLSILNGFIYIVDNDNDRVIKRLLSDFSFVNKIGDAGSGDDQFSSAVAALAYGNYVYVADYGGDRISVRSAQADQLTFVKTPAAGSFSWPISDTGVTNTDTLVRRVRQTVPLTDTGSTIIESLVKSARRLRTITDTGSTVTESLKRTNVNRSLTDLGVALVEAGWRAKTTVFSTTVVNGIARSENDDMWVAVADAGKLATSTDRGITWTLQTSSFSSTNINAVARSDSEDLWVAVGDTGKLATSSDGTTWTQQTSGFSTTGILDVAYSASEDLWIAVGNSGKYSTSPDGTTWTAQSVLFSGDTINGIARSDTADMWVVVGSNGNLATSDNGTSWQFANSSFGSSIIYSIAYSERLGMWVATGQAGTLASSFDGVIWTQRTSGFGSGAVFDVAYSETTGVWGIVGSGGRLSTSVDGINWTLRASPDFSTTQINGIEYSPARDTWIIVGSTGKISGTLAESIVSKRTRPLTDTGSTISESLVRLVRRTRALSDDGLFSTFPQNAVLDDFNRANGGAGAAWSTLIGTEAVSNITSNALLRTSGVESNRWNATTFGPNSEAFMDVPGDDVGVWTRVVTPSASGQPLTGYVAYLDASRTRVSLWKADGTGFTGQVGSYVTSLPTQDALGIRCVGTTISVYGRSSGVWTRHIQATDSSHSAAGYIANELFSSGSSVDNFGGGTFVTDSLVSSKRRFITLADDGLTQRVPIVSVVEDFNRADGAAGANWQPRIGSGTTPVISSNEASDGWDSYWVPLSNTILNQESFATWTHNGGFNAIQGWHNYRIQNPGATEDCYEVDWGGNFFRVIGGSYTNIGSFGVPVFSVGDKYGGRVYGSGASVTLEAWKYVASTGTWTLLGSVTDTNAARIVTPGYFGWGTSDVGSRYDNFAAGEATLFDSLTSSVRRTLTDSGMYCTPQNAVLEPFTGSGALSGSWTAPAFTGNSTPERFTDVAVTANGTYGSALYNAVAYGVDQEAYCTVPSAASGMSPLYLYCKVKNPNTGTSCYYTALFSFDNDQLYIAREYNASGADLVSGEAFTFTPGDKVLLKTNVVGADIVITVWVDSGSGWTLRRSVTDTGAVASYPLLASTGGNLAFAFYGEGLSVTRSIDDFGGGTLVTDSLVALLTPGGGGGTTYPVTASDTGITQTDSLVKLAVLFRAISDTGVTLTDVLGPRIYHNISDTGVTSSDSLVKLARLTRAISDTGFTFSESLVKLATRIRNISDTGVTSSDSLVKLARITRALTDTGSTQTDTVVDLRTRPITDTGFTFSESLVKLARLTRAITDTGLTLTDVLAERISHYLTDTGVTQTDTLVKSASKTLTDTGSTITDTIVDLRTRVLSDTGLTQTDSLVKTQWLHFAITDTGVTQTDTIVDLRNRALSDNGSTISDTLVATRRLSITISDTAVTQTDELIKGRYLFISDTGVTQTDSLVATRRLSLTLSDTGVTNTDNLVSNRNRPLTTTGVTNTDSLSTLRVRTLTDTGVSLTDVLGPRIYHNLTDTGTTVSDTLVRLLIATRSISDTGVTNTDSLVIYRVRPKTLTDTGVTPGDTLVSLRQFYRINTDTGLTQTDSLVKLARITRSATDTGVTQTDSLTTARSRTLTDPGTTNTDSLATRRNHVLTDTALTQTDSVNVSSGLNISISDTGITQTDSLAAQRSFFRTLTDTAVTHSDTLASNRNRILVTTGNLYSDSLTTVRRRYLSDTGVSLTDVLAERIYHNLTDTGVTNTDSLVRRLIATRSISDTGVTQTDNLSVSTSGSVQISDTGLTQTDSLVATRRFLRTLSTTGETQTDSLVTYRRVSISLTDTGVSLTDVLAERIYHNCTDTGVTQTDTLVATRRFFKSLTDTGNSHTDLLISSAESSENLTDTGLTHNDSLALRVGRYISDTGTAQTDSLSPTREFHITLSDQGLTQTDTLVAFRFTEAFKIIAEEPYRRYYATMTTHYESQLSYSHWSQMKLNVFKAYYVREWYRRWKS